MQILCFNYEHNTEDSKNLHNISLAIGVLGRAESINTMIEGSPAIAIDINNDGVIFASAYIILRKADVQEYWGEGTDKLMTEQVVAYALTERKFMGKNTERWYPKSSSGKPKAVASMLKDHSELMSVLWQRLTNQELTPNHFLTNL